ncbi:MAG: DUF2889 domain-containing protein [Pseudomonadota bacterium]
MPLSDPGARREIHHRVIDMKAYARDDGLYDAEAHLVDTKPFDFLRPSSPVPAPAGQALHDLWIRITVDGEYTVRAIEAASDVTPWAICREAEATLSELVGERLVRGWSAKVKERLRGVAGCTHLMEMLIPLATTALQGINALRPETFRSPGKIDSCYAFGREREVVRILWPEHWQSPGAPDTASQGDRDTPPTGT